MRKLMLGNEAVARGAWEAGVTVASAYPGTPSTEITEYIAGYDDIYAEWAPNEKVSLEVAVGASVAGARAICAMKHVGLNVAADPLFTASYTGVHGGLVICVADDPGMHSSQNEQDSRHYARGAKLPMLEPADSQECKDFIRHGFEISEAFDTPVMIRLTTRIAHSQSIVEVSDRLHIPLKPYVKNFEKYVMMPAMARKRHVVVEDRMKRLQDWAESTELNSVIWGDRRVGIITSGVAYQYAREVFPEASFLKIGLVWPLPEQRIRDFAAGVEKLIVIEELDAFIESAVRGMGIVCTGKDKVPLVGELSVNTLKHCFGMHVPEGTRGLDDVVPVRPPVMCPGCPHRGMYHAVRRLKLHVSGDIGCYTLGALPPTESMDTCICMGASVSGAHGMEKARGTGFAKETVAVIGDSTFIHSGITGLIDIVYNKGTSTTLILDNSITGMTGHQHNPTTGFTIKGEPAPQVNLELLCQAVGVRRVRVEDPFDVDGFTAALKEELSAEEPSVIISRRPCALLKGVQFDGPLKIRTDACKKCRQCLAIGCPAIVSEGDRIVINNALCVGCGLCARICKFGAMERADR